MGRTFTVAQLIARVRQAADIQHMDSANGFITDNEIMGYLSDSYTELYDILVSKGINQFESSATLSVTSGVASVPADFYAALGVYRVENDFLIPLKEVYLKDIHRYRTSEQGNAYAFRVVGEEIHLYPPPSSGTYKLYYAPFATKFALTSDTVDGVNGWEEYLVLDATIKCQDKEESSSEGTREKKRDMLNRIDAMAENRTVGPHSVVDTLNMHGYRDPASWYNDLPDI